MFPGLVDQIRILINLRLVKGHQLVGLLHVFRQFQVSQSSFQDRSREAMQGSNVLPKFFALLGGEVNFSIFPSSIRIARGLV